MSFSKARISPNMITALRNQNAQSRSERQILTKWDVQFVNFVIEIMIPADIWPSYMWNEQKIQATMYF